MSLWLQSVIGHLADRKYKQVRDNLLPISPIPIPDCLKKELDFGEKCCNYPEPEPLFPIRFLWLLEGNEYRRFNLPMLNRSHYHPEVLLFDIWNRVVSEPDFKKEMESDGFRFNLDEKSLSMSRGWVFIGNHFIEDFLEIEMTLGIELLFPDKDNNKLRPVFQDYKANKDK